MKRIVIHLLAVLPCLATLGQLAGTTTNLLRSPDGFLPAPVEPPLVRSVPTKTTTDPATNLSTAVAGGYVLDDKHKLLPGDRVSFQITQDRTNAVPLLVAESSELDIPYIGRISVAGRTCRDLADEVKTQLEKDYYHKATVIIGLDSLTKVLGKVYVYGPVRNPGPVEIPASENFTASKAILRAGGFGDFANKKEVKVVRKTPTGNTTFKINMVDVLEKGKTESDVLLESEDFIYIPQRSINW